MIFTPEYTIVNWLAGLRLHQLWLDSRVHSASDLPHAVWPKLPPTLTSQGWACRPRPLVGRHERPERQKGSRYISRHQPDLCPTAPTGPPWGCHPPGHSLTLQLTLLDGRHDRQRLPASVGIGHRCRSAPRLTEVNQLNHFAGTFPAVKTRYWFYQLI